MRTVSFSLRVLHTMTVNQLATISTIVQQTSKSIDFATELEEEL